MLNINDLFVFLEAATCNNYSQTARNLSFSQPAISQKIKSLEDRFGVELFQRQGHSMKLTPAGKTLQTLAQDLVSKSHELEEKMTVLRDDVIGEITISCSMTLGKYVLTGLIAAFCKQYPLVKVQIECRKKNDSLAHILKGEIDFGLVGKINERLDLEYQELFTDDIILVVPAGHALTKRKKISLSDLLDIPTVLLEEPAGMREVFFEALAHNAIEPDTINVVMELDNVESMALAVEEGLGIAFLSRLSVVRGLKLGKIAEVQVENLELKRKIYMVRSKTRNPTQAQQAFWEFIDTQNNFDHLCSITGLSCFVQEC